MLLHAGDDTLQRLDSGASLAASACCQAAEPSPAAAAVAAPARCCTAAAAPARPQMDEWLHNMLQTQFFTPCSTHRDHKKNEATYFCADCGVAPRPLCAHCATGHAGHRIIQIRRYVYCDVVRATDMSPHLDVAGVQTYIINQAKVMFLNPRPQSKMGRPGAPDACVTCSRTLREGCSFCSLACKVESLISAGRLGAPSSPAAGAASDSSDCWPAAHHHAPPHPAKRPRSAGAAAPQPAVAPAPVADGASGDSSSSHQLRAYSWGQDGAQDLNQVEVHQTHAHSGSHARAWARRHSDTDSDGRCSSGSLCCRRKQASPRRSPLL